MLCIQNYTHSKLVPLSEHHQQFKSDDACFGSYRHDDPMAVPCRLLALGHRLRPDGYHRRPAVAGPDDVAAVVVAAADYRIATVY